MQSDVQPGAFRRASTAPYLGTHATCSKGEGVEVKPSIKVHNSLVCTLIGISVLGVFTEARGQEAARFAIIDVGDFGGLAGTIPRAINNNGVIAGDTWDVRTNDILVFRWRDGVVEFLEPPVPGFDSQASGINEQDEIVGYSYVASGVQHAVRWIANGTPVDLGTLGGEDSFAYDTSENGQIVGSSDLSGSGQHAFLWEDGQFTDLGDLGRPTGGANAINSSRQIVGSSGIVPSSSRAFLWEDGQMFNLGTLPDGSRSSARDVNTSSMIVGVAHATNGQDQAVIWEDRVIRSIHRSSIGIASDALAINDSGQVVGHLDVDGTLEEFSGFLYEGSGPMVDIRTVLPPNHTWRQIANVADINDLGEIVAYGDRVGGSNQGYRAVLITPVHITLTLQGPQPGRAGTLNGLRVTGCTPGARVSFYYSTHGGGTLVPGCNHTDGVTLQLDDPIQIGSAVANQNGIATLTRFVPTGARNLGDVLIQAVQQNGCRISQLVVKRFE